MKHVSKEEAQKLEVTYRGNQSPLYLALIRMQPGDILQVEPQDWKRKSHPSVLLRAVEKKTKSKYTVGTIKGNKGWLVTRLA